MGWLSWRPAGSNGQKRIDSLVRAKHGPLYSKSINTQIYVLFGAKTMRIYVNLLIQDDSNIFFKKLGLVWAEPPLRSFKFCLNRSCECHFAPATSGRRKDPKGRAWVKRTHPKTIGRCSKRFDDSNNAVCSATSLVLYGHCSIQVILFTKMFQICVCVRALNVSSCLVYHQIGLIKRKSAISFFDLLPSSQDPFRRPSSPSKGWRCSPSSARNLRKYLPCVFVGDLLNTFAVV